MYLRGIIHSPWRPGRDAGLDRGFTAFGLPVKPNQRFLAFGLGVRPNRAFVAPALALEGFPVANLGLALPVVSRRLIFRICLPSHDLRFILFHAPSRRPLSATQIGLHENQLDIDISHKPHMTMVYKYMQRDT